MADHLVTIAEALTAADATTARSDFVLSLADSSTVTDFSPGLAVMSVDLAEGGAPADAYTVGWVMSVVEAATATDAYSVQRNSPRSLVEGIVATDASGVSSISGYATIVEGLLAEDLWEATSSADGPAFYPAYENINPLFMDLYVNDVLIVGGVLMLDRVFAVRDDYLGFVGDLAIVDTQGNQDPVGVPLRLPPPDLRNVIQRALPLALGGKMPPEGQPNKVPGLGTRWLLTYWPARPTTTAPSTAYQIVPTTDAPSQRISVTLGGQSCRIDIYTKSLNVPVWNPGEIIT